MDDVLHIEDYDERIDADFIKQLAIPKCRLSVWGLLPGRAQTGAGCKEVVPYERVDALESLGGRNDYGSIHLFTDPYVIGLATNRTLKLVSAGLVQLLSVLVGYCKAGCPWATHKGMSRLIPLHGPRWQPAS